MSSTPTQKTGFFRFLGKHFYEARIWQAAGSLTFATLLALVPLLTVMLVVVTAFPVFGNASNQFMELVNSILVPEGASAVSRYLEEFKNQAGGLTAAGLAVMTAGALMLMQTIERTFDSIWHTRNRRPLAVRLSIYWALLTLLPVLIGTGMSLSTHLSAWLPQFSGSLQNVWTFALAALLLFLLYRFAPNSRVPLGSALTGAVLAALLLEAAKWGFGLYVRHFNSYHTVYGAFAAIPLFLLWLHLLWTIVLGGAVLTAALAFWKNGVHRYPDSGQADFDAAVQILLLLKSAQFDGKSLPAQTLAKRINLGGERLDSLLEKLAQHNYISLGPNGWLLKTAAEQIILKELFERLVYLPALEGNDVLRGVRKLMQPGLENLNLSLTRFEQGLVSAESIPADTPPSEAKA